MSHALLYLSYMGIILLLGLILTVIAQKIKVPNVLLLIVAGIIINMIPYEGGSLVLFPEDFLVAIGILALVTIVFDSSSRFKLKDFDVLSMSALKLTAVFLLFCIAILSVATHYLYGVSYAIAFLFASLMAGTAPDVVLSMIKETTNKSLQLIEIEAILNTPIIVLIPFIIIDFIQSVETQLIFQKFVEQIAPFLQQIITGVGTGVIIGIIMFKIMRKWYSERLSPLVLFVASLLTYVIAEWSKLGGNGVLAVTTLGLVFGSVSVRQKEEIRGFSFLLSNFLEIFVFILIGMIIDLPTDLVFYLISFGLFLVYLGIRFLAVELSLYKDFNKKEKIFISLNCPKGIAVAVVIFLLATFQIEGISRITDLVLIFMLYSIIVSSVVARFSRYFIRTEILKGK